MKLDRAVADAAASAMATLEPFELAAWIGAQLR
jgi:hypothetical protein